MGQSGPRMGYHGRLRRIFELPFAILTWLPICRWLTYLPVKSSISHSCVRLQEGFLLPDRSMVCHRGKAEMVSGETDLQMVGFPKCDVIWLVVTGTWLIFEYIGNVIIPDDVHIFQRGWNHQPVIDVLYGAINILIADLDYYLDLGFDLLPR